MERSYKILLLFFTAIMVISLSGFFYTYLRFFPDFDRFRLVIHIHFIAFICWFLLLIIQPVLIRQRRYALHRKLGKLSGLLAPVLMITIFLLVKDKAQRELAVSTEAAAMTAFIGLLDMVSFSAYYSIAMLRRKHTRWHVAFLIAASLVVLNPGLARLLHQFQPGLGLAGAVLVPFIVSITIISYEKIKLKRPVLKNPYLVFFLCWTLEIILLAVVPQTLFWQRIVSALVN